MEVIGMLTKKQRELGLKLIEIDDHFLELRVGSELICSFTKLAMPEEIQNEAYWCERVIEGFLKSDAFGEYASKWAFEMGWREPK